MRTYAVNISVAIFSIGVTLLTAEGVLRFYKPYASLGAGTELAWVRQRNERTKIYTQDPHYGFRPVLGNERYSKYGTRPNAYALEKRPGVKRLLFIGDSVTRRGKIIDALKDIYGEEAYEYWNAGVEAFNTVQEVEGDPWHPSAEIAVLFAQYLYEQHLFDTY